MLPRSTSRLGRAPTACPIFLNATSEPAQPGNERHTSQQAGREDTEDYDCQRGRISRTPLAASSRKNQWVLSNDRFCSAPLTTTSKQTLTMLPTNNVAQPALSQDSATLPLVAVYRMAATVPLYVAQDGPDTGRAVVTLSVSSASVQYSVGASSVEACLSM